LHKHLPAHRKQVGSFLAKKYTVLPLKCLHQISAFPLGMKLKRFHFNKRNSDKEITTEFNGLFSFQAKKATVLKGWAIKKA